MMTSLTRRFSYQPYTLFLLTALVLFISSFFLFGQTVDIHLHDTYYVIAKNHFVLTLALGFLAGWTLYKLTNRFMRTKYLTWTHIVLTLTSLLLLILAILWNHKTATPENGQAGSIQALIEKMQKQRLTALIMETSFVFGQLAFIANLAMGPGKRRI